MLDFGQQVPGSNGAFPKSQDLLEKPVWVRNKERSYCANPERHQSQRATNKGKKRKEREKRTHWSQF